MPFSNNSPEKIYHPSTPDTLKPKFDSKVLRDGLRLLATSALAFTITSCGEKPKEVQVDPVMQQQEVVVQNERKIIQKELKDRKLEIKNIQAQIDRTENQEERLKLVVKFDDLTAKYREYFAGLSFEDREYFKNRIDLIN